MNEKHHNATKTRKAGRRAGVRLQIRDIHILEALVERRCETLDYLHEHFFAGLSRKRALGRLRDLERAGLIHREGDIWLWDRYGPVSIYHLTKDAKEVLEVRSALGDQLRGRSFRSLWVDVCWPKQIAINRIGDWLGTQLMPEPLFTGADPWRRHWSRPDAIYQAAERDREGRDHVYVVADFGGITPDRQVGTAKAFLEDRKARSLLHISPTDYLCDIATANLREALSYDEFQRLQFLTIEMIREGGWLDPGTQPQGGHTWQARTRSSR
jgi:hypothetical protein